MAIVDSALSPSPPDQPDRGTSSANQSTANNPYEMPAGLWRQTTEFLIVLGICILLFRTFAAEAYVVPTGSMAPTLLGIHCEVPCANCHYRFCLGLDERGRAGRPICPNCGQASDAETPKIACNGDRLLVQKFLVDFRPVRRWEVAVFQSPSEPNQAYVKRVIGLPGEMVQIRQGDIWIDGRIARKTLEEQRGMRIPVYDNRFPPSDAARYPRWVFRRGRDSRGTPTGWSEENGVFRHQRTDGPGELVDWIDYRHWDPETGRYGPIRDFCPYNGADIRGENVVHDLMLEAKISVGADVREINVRVNRGGDTLFVHLPVDKPGQARVQRNGLSLSLDDCEGGLLSSPAGKSRVQQLEVSVVDRRLTVALDGHKLFTPFDFQEDDRGPGPFATPIGIGIEGGTAEVSDLRIYRDIFYTSALFSALKRPFGVDVPYSLGSGEYFVLGDNSPVSNDSRFWPDSPVVRASALIGKPFLVHLPGQMFMLKVFGRSLCWIPDPREIRYIR